VAQYWEDWSGSTIGQAPVGWTKRWDTAPNYTIEADSSGYAPAGKRLKITRGAGSAHGLLALDAVDADPDRARVQVTMLVSQQTAATASANTYGGAAARCAGPASSRTGASYVISTSTQTSPASRSTSLFANEGAAAEPYYFLGDDVWEAGNFYWLTFDLDGDQADFSLAPVDDPETPVYQGTQAINQPLGPGWVGIHTFANVTDLRVLAFGVGTGGDPAPMSNPVSDTTAPVLTSPGASASGTTGATGSVVTDEGNGTLYWLASASASATATAVKAGQSQAVSSVGVQNVEVSGLLAGASYYLHFLHQDAAGNESDVATSPQFTTNALAVKGVRVQIGNGTTPADLATVRVRWYDDEGASGAPDFESDVVPVGADGWIELDLDAFTALNIGDHGYLLIPLPGATAQDDQVAGGRVPVVDIA
jgi:hypothetical protein